MADNLIGKLNPKQQMTGALNQPLIQTDHSKLENLEFYKSGHTGFTSASDFSAFASGLSEVAKTGSYNDLLQKPVIPTKNSQLVNDSDFQNKLQTDASIEVHDTSNIAHQFIQDNLSTEITTRQNADANLQNQIVANDTDIANLKNTKANIANPNFTGTVSGITKTMVGLGNVDNTSDLNKPVSNATQIELDLKANVNSLAKVATTGEYIDLKGTPIVGNNNILSSAKPLSQKNNDIWYKIIGDKV